MGPDALTPQGHAVRDGGTCARRSLSTAVNGPRAVHVVRVAYEDRYPSGTDLRDAVYRDLRRYCAVMGLGFRYEDVWFFSGMRWELDDGYYLPTSVRGVRASVETTALPPGEAERRRRHELTRPRPIPPGTARRRHWNDAINGMTRRQRRRLRRGRRKRRQRARRSIDTASEPSRGTPGRTAALRPPHPTNSRSTLMGGTTRMPTPNGAFADHPVLEAMLPVAVLAALDEVAQLTADERRCLATDFANAIASHGDDLMFGGKHCAATFTALARGLAVLAHQPGGVGFAGLHWCVGSRHHGTREQTPCAAELAREAQQADQSR